MVYASCSVCSFIKEGYVAEGTAEGASACCHHGDRGSSSNVLWCWFVDVDINKVECGVCKFVEVGGECARTVEYYMVFFFVCNAFNVF